MTIVDLKSGLFAVLWSIPRNEQKRFLEDAITKFRPDGYEGEELLMAVKAGVKGPVCKERRKAEEALDRAGELLVDMEDAEDTENPFNGPDEMDLARERRQAEEAI